MNHSDDENLENFHHRFDNSDKQSQSLHEPRVCKTSLSLSYGVKLLTNTGPVSRNCSQNRVATIFPL